MAMAVRLAVLLLAVAVLHVGVAAAQSGGCQCDGPPCLEAPQRTPTGSECIKVPRPDCPCCLVCGHQEGELCDDLSQPCDLSSRLFCNTTSGLCQKGKTRLFWILITGFLGWYLWEQPLQIPFVIVVSHLSFEANTAVSCCKLVSMAVVRHLTELSSLVSR